jgi:LCP family protein required for cell wall assembly
MTGPKDGPDAGNWPQLPPELNPRGRKPAAAGATGRPAGAGAPGGSGQPGAPAPAKRRRSRKRIFAWVAGSLAVLLVVGGVTSWAAISHFLGNISRVNVFAGLTHRPSGGVSGDLNILLVGSDSRAGLTPAQQRALHVGHDPGQRSDTMILLHIPRGGGKAVLVSLPRDSYVVIPAHKDANGRDIAAAHNKLNAAYSAGGPELTVATVEANTHVRIDHYVEINFLGFTKMVNALGGVTVCTPKAINDPVHYDPASGGNVGSGLRLKAGRTTVNGATALAYVRAREFDPSADIGRIQRQQKFMSALVQKAESTGTLLNPFKLVSFLNAVTGSLKTDPGFGASQMERLAKKLHSMAASHVELLTVPLASSNARALIGGSYASVVKWDPVLAPQLFTDLTTDRPVDAADQGKAAKVTIPPSNIAVGVRNATTTQGMAAGVATQLSSLGFHITGTGNAPTGSDPNVTVVTYGPSRADSARTVAAAIPGAKLKVDPAVGSAIRVIVGANFHGVQRVVISSPSAGSSGGTGLQIRTASQDICS